MLFRSKTFTNDPGIDTTKASNSTFVLSIGQTTLNSIVKKYSDVAFLSGTPAVGVKGLVIGYGKTATDLQKIVYDTRSVDEKTVEMAKGTATNTKCDDKCFVPNKVTITAGGTVTWKNVDSAGHFATSADGKTFDTGMVNAGASSAAVTMNTAGTYDYMCMVHPWMKGTVVVKIGRAHV